MTSVEVLGLTDTLTADNEKYAEGLKAVAKAFNEALDIFNAPDFVSKSGWKKESESPTHDTIYSKHSDTGKLFVLRCEMPKDCETVFKDNWEGINELTKWNSNLAFSKVVATLSDYADVCHCSLEREDMRYSCDAGLRNRNGQMNDTVRGLCEERDQAFSVESFVPRVVFDVYGNRDILVVKGRDFLIARMHRKIHNGYITVGRSFELADIPETKANIRGELLMGAGRFMPKDSDPNVTVIDYILSVDLKGAIPKLIVNQTNNK